MIRDGIIVYDPPSSTFLEFQFDSDVLNVMVLGALTTIFAYQVTAIAYNICLGLKARGRATACDIHKLILMEASSPLAIFAAISRLDNIDRVRFKNDLPDNIRIARTGAKVGRRTVINLVLLLLIAPTFNIISIFFVLERFETVTFEQAKFGGVALGVRQIDQNDTQIESFTPTCSRVPFRVSGASKALVRFVICLGVKTKELLTMETSGPIRLSVETTNQGEIVLSLKSLSSDESFSLLVHFDIVSDTRLLRIRPALLREGASELIRLGQEGLALSCEEASLQNSPFEDSLLQFKESNGLLKVSKDFNCDYPERKLVIEITGFKMTERISVIEQGSMQVVDAKEIKADATELVNYFDGGKLPFLLRQRRNLSVGLLLLLLLISIVIRAITGFFFHNDLDAAVEAVVRDKLSIEPHESMLRSTKTVTYNRRYQQGSLGHFGVPRSTLPLVEEYNTGLNIEIGVEDQASSRTGVFHGGGRF